MKPYKAITAHVIWFVHIVIYIGGIGIKTFTLGNTGILADGSLGSPTVSEANNDEGLGIPPKAEKLLLNVAGALDFIANNFPNNGPIEGNLGVAKEIGRASCRERV